MWKVRVRTRFNTCDPFITFSWCDFLYETCYCGQNQSRQCIVIPKEYNLKARSFFMLCLLERNFSCILFGVTLILLANCEQDKLGFNRSLSEASSTSFFTFKLWSYKLSAFYGKSRVVITVIFTHEWILYFTQKSVPSCSLRVTTKVAFNFSLCKSSLQSARSL